MKSLTATADRYTFAHGTHVYGTPQQQREIVAERAEIREHFATNEDRLREEARKVLAYIESDEFSGSSEYVVNLKAVASGKSVDHRNLALLLSAVGAYRRHLGQVAERTAKAAAPRVDEFVGQEKEKLVLRDLAVVSTRIIESQYGVSHLYTFNDAEGRSFKWFSSNDMGWSEGDKVAALQATVKGHEEYKGRKSTVITRCKEINPLTGKPFKTGYQIVQAHQYGEHQESPVADCHGCYLAAQG